MTGIISTSYEDQYDNSMIIVKGIAIPLQALRGSEGSRRLMLPDFKTIDT
jgi:hypothetical protein